MQNKNRIILSSLTGKMKVQAVQNCPIAILFQLVILQIRYYTVYISTILHKLFTKVTLINLEVARKKYKGKQGSQLCLTINYPTHTVKHTVNMLIIRLFDF